MIRADDGECTDLCGPRTSLSPTPEWPRGRRLCGGRDRALSGRRDRPALRRSVIETRRGSRDRSSSSTISAISSPDTDRWRCSSAERPDNPGFGAAANAGIGCSPSSRSFTVYVVLNNDSEVRPGFLDAAADATRGRSRGSRRAGLRPGGRSKPCGMREVKSTSSPVRFARTTCLLRPSGAGTWATYLRRRWL